MEQFAVVSGANHWKKVIAGKFPVNLLFFFGGRWGGINLCVK